MRGAWKQECIQIGILIILYILLGNARSVQPNPYIPGAVIAVNMIVPIIAGVLFGWRSGLFVGLFGTTLNAISPAGSIFEFLAIIPHMLMGVVAGCLKDRVIIPLAACTILLGHLLNISFFVFFGAMETALLTDPSLWKGILYESFIGVIVITIIATIYNMLMETP